MSEEFQEVREPVAMEGLKLDPTFPKRLVLSNLIRRVILWGFNDTLNRFLSLKATSSGELMVDDAGATTALAAIQAAVEGTLEVNDADGETLLTAIAAALAGTLAVSADAQIPNAFERYGVASGDAWSAYQAFGFTSHTITIICETNPVSIQFKDKDSAETDEIELPADTGLSLDLKMTEYRHKNKTGGSNAYHQLIATTVA